MIISSRKQLSYRIFHSLPSGAKKYLRILAAPMYHANILRKDFLSRIGVYKYRHRILFVAGLPKSGTTWVENFLFHIPGYNPRYLGGSADVLFRQNIPAEAFDNFPPHAYSFVKFHMKPSRDNLAVLARKGVNRIVVMYRDPRDVAVSRYYHLLNFPKFPDQIDSIDYSRSMSKEEGLQHSVDAAANHFVAWIRGWTELIKTEKNLKFLVIRYEDLRRDPQGTFRSLLDFYELPFSDRQLNDILLRTRTNRKKDFSPRGLVGKKTTFRKGQIGDWRHEFSENHKASFKARCGDFLIEYGYEDDHNW